ncbi:helix-turn-helix transcriptional regulator [Paenibacillus xerothermodurans]|uniref:Helix-turn-helix domain-containing protein n=1 Tax=Paenibacillus xerothermodurans TaxID=1977292 RepID=A0A2W1NNN1_PAEXE|nr:helix-turn-helix domain-containing protein [Paenibacillus xerothermodurans]PZE21075.1 helix-turn-helix domain-containing protein [Paenibacillus xerothermodurans]
MSFEDIHAAYHESLKAFRINALSDQSDDFFHADQPEPLSDDLSSPKIMTAFICDKEYEMIELGVSRYIRCTIMSDGTVSREDMIRQLLNYISQIHVHVSTATAKELEEIPMKVWETFDECRTLEELASVLCQYLINLSKELFSPASNAMVERALQMIAERYMEELTLQVIADELSLHPVWLSQLIKKETGQSYMDHLTETRIQRAKVLLRESNFKIYEIVEAVGYHDLQHFGNVFKKRTGQTPKEYRYGK